ncbi:hypothetical protein CW712_06005 [Candidatus Bathyarchaeota archaeon]|nr:MAG: hypothetical protein CW712_06005 [Candidatus Bathyarchaeota archaeon]
MTRQKSKEFVRVFLFFINEIERIPKNIYIEKISENQRQKKSAQQHIMRYYQKNEMSSAEVFWFNE